MKVINQKKIINILSHYYTLQSYTVQLIHQIFQQFDVNHLLSPFYSPFLISSIIFLFESVIHSTLNEFLYVNATISFGNLTPKSQRRVVTTENVASNYNLCSSLLQLQLIKMLDSVLFFVVNDPFPPIMTPNSFFVSVLWRDIPNITSQSLISQGNLSILKSFQKNPAIYFFSVRSMKMLIEILFSVINFTAFYQQGLSLSKTFALSIIEVTIFTAASLLRTIGFTSLSPNTNWFKRASLSSVKSFVLKLRAIPLFFLEEKGTLEEKCVENLAIGTVNNPDIFPTYLFLSPLEPASSPTLVLIDSYFSITTGSSQITKDQIRSIIYFGSYFFSETQFYISLLISLDYYTRDQIQVFQPKVVFRTFRAKKQYSLLEQPIIASFPHSSLKIHLFTFFLHTPPKTAWVPSFQGLLSWTQLAVFWSSDFNRKSQSCIFGSIMKRRITKNQQNSSQVISAALMRKKRVQNISFKVPLAGLRVVGR